jgi:hypothetical protein
MAIPLYDLSVMTYVQMLGAVNGFLEKGRAYCSENKIDLDEIVESRVFPDMFPFRFQIHSVVHHSVGAIEGIKRGVFGPPQGFPDHDYSGLQALVREALETVRKITPAEINAYEARDVTFEYKDVKLPFTTEGFLLSFSLPNLYFHAATAYDILRAKGVPVGKRDFLGRLQLKA